MSGLLQQAIDKVKTKIEDDCLDENVGTSERILSVIAGGFIVGIGVKKLFKSPIAAVSGLSLGGALIYRGVTGHCAMKKSIGDPEVKEVEVIEHRYFVK